MNGLSILIPTYNYPCVVLVRILHQQATTIGIPFEILVADDGSTDDNIICQNEAINEWESCRLLCRQQNIGRAAIRNYLAQQSSFDRLLFIDSDMVVCNEDFINNYITTQAPVVDGGITIGKPLRGNLRSIYEHAEESRHGVEQRRLRPYHDFHTANFMIQRNLMLQHPFDERYSRYGYEDVAFGVSLKNHQIEILHIDNPLSFEVFESNEAFLEKTEEGMRTLYQFRNELKDYSRLLQAIDSLPRPVLSLLITTHKYLGNVIRCQLTGSHPSLLLFKIYKVGYYLCYAKKQSF